MQLYPRWFGESVGPKGQDYCEKVSTALEHAAVLSCLIVTLGPPYDYACRTFFCLSGCQQPLIGSKYGVFYK